VRGSEVALRGTVTSVAAAGSVGTSHRNKSVAAAAPISPQIRQMARNGGLRQLEHLDHVADAQLTAGDQMQNAQAERIGSANARNM
jgi:hypothetical protein